MSLGMGPTIRGHIKVNVDGSFGGVGRAILEVFLGI